MNYNRENMKNLEDSNGNIQPGETYRATVIGVCDVGVSVQMPGGKGSGTISTKCWGKGEERARALSEIMVGDKLNVVVKSFDCHGPSLSLVLEGCKNFASVYNNRKKRGEQQVMRFLDDVMRSAMPKPKHEKAKGHGVSRKPMYQPLEKGTTLLIDTANLLHCIGRECGFEHAAWRLGTIAEVLADRGYKALFFWEHRAYAGTCHGQANESEVVALREFSQRKDVSLVGEEADIAILQAAQELPGSVMVTRDLLRDYAEVFPELVGSKRHRGFSMIEVDGRILVTIYGLKDAIVIPEYVPEEQDDWLIEVDEEVLARRAERPEVTPSRRGLLGVADSCIENGKVRRGIALFERLARKSPKIYRDIAQVFGDGKAIPADTYAVTHYERLADRGEKALRERHRRNCRLKAERRRVDGIGHWSHAA